MRERKSDIEGEWDGKTESENEREFDKMRVRVREKERTKTYLWKESIKCCVWEEKWKQKKLSKEILWITDKRRQIAFTL